MEGWMTKVQYFITQKRSLLVELTDLNHDWGQSLHALVSHCVLLRRVDFDEQPCLRKKKIA